MSGTVNKANGRQYSKRSKRYAPYAAAQRMLTNKFRRMARTLKRQPNNTELQEQAKRLVNDHPVQARGTGIKELV